MCDEKQKQILIEEIQRRIEYLISTDEISDAKKVEIAREALNIIENGEKEGAVKWQA